MIVTFLQTLATFFFKFSSVIIMNILKPFFDKLVEWGTIPSNYLTTLNNFIDNLVRYIQFAKKSIINITGLPNQIFSILITLVLVVFVLYAGSLGIKALLNVWGIFRTGRSMYNTRKK